MRRVATTLVLLCALAAPAGAATHRIAAISITPATLPAATTGSAYAQALTGNGGTGPYTFVVTAGSLPPGLSLASGGNLSGTPTSSGSYSFTITATDSLAVSGSQAFSLSVSPATVTITPTSLSPASRSVFYSAFLTGNGGTAPYTFAVTSGTLPSGLSLSSNGTLLGTPGASGSFTFTVTATDSQGSTGSRSYTLNVNVANLDINPATLPDGTPGSAYAQVLTGTGGSAPYTFALANGTSLPPGLSLSSGGFLTGTPSAVGRYTFTVKVTDAASQTTTRAYAVYMTASPVTIPGTLASGQYGKSYSQTLAASGGSVPYTFVLVSGALPAGVTLSSIGALSGTPTAWGSYQFNVSATDKYGNTGTFPFTLVVAAPSIVLSPSTLFAATPGLFYAASLNATGGLGTYSYSLTAGVLPAGLALAVDGTLSGTVNDSVGLYTFTVQATDANGAAGSVQLTLAVATPPILFTSLGLSGGVVGAAYEGQLTATGGSAPYTFSLVDGALPGGLSLSLDGKLTGTPNAAGTWLFTVLLVDAHGVRVAQSFRLVVEKPAAAAKAKAKKSTKKKTTKKRVVMKHVF